MDSQNPVPETVPTAAAPITPVVAAAPSVEGQVYAGFWRRVVAYFVDSAVCLAASTLVYAVAILGFHRTYLEISQNVWISVVMAVAYLLYFVLAESSAWQATVGKRLMGLSVTDKEGKRISFLRSLGRMFAKLIPVVVIPFVYMIAFAMAFVAMGSTAGIVVFVMVMLTLTAAMLAPYAMAGWTKKKQALHDKIAGTLVMKVRPAKTGLVVGLIVIFFGGLIGIAAFQTSTLTKNVTSVKNLESYDLGTPAKEVLFTLPAGYEQASFTDEDTGIKVYPANHNDIEAVVALVFPDMETYLSYESDFRDNGFELDTAPLDVGGEAAEIYVPKETSSGIARVLVIPSMLTAVIVSTPEWAEVSQADIDAIVASIRFR